jgi:chemotaxis protein CheY-P-specific phosphatase CheC
MPAPTVFLRELERLSAYQVPDVLETMFFANAVPNEQGAIEQPSYAVRVRFRGFPSGVFELTIGARIATVLAAGFLGMDESEVGPMEASQVACELANMLCGSVLSRAESETGFELSPPLLVAALEHDAVDYRARFAVDLGDSIEISFTVEEPVVCA